jgi:hypothetical protein
MKATTLRERRPEKQERSKNQERLHVVLFSLFYPAVLGTFFFTLFPEILRFATSPWEFSAWDLGKTGIAVLLVFHFVFDFVYTSEISKYNIKIFMMDLLILVSFFVAYSAVHLGSDSEMDIKTLAGAMAITYFLFRLWAYRVGGIVRDDEALGLYEFGSALLFVIVMVLAMVPVARVVTLLILTFGLLASAVAMWIIAPGTLKAFKREGCVDVEG